MRAWQHAMTKSIRMRTRHLLASAVIGAIILTLTPMLGTWPQSAAQAQYIVDAEFRAALSPYGRWHHHSRWGEVWIPDPVSADWRPYTRGRWLYTEEWGWYWETADEEAEWGWVTNHYGRWVHDPELGWMWVPGQDWAPAWVDWRHGEDYVGWAPLPPDDLLVEYRDDPIYWCFVRPRYLLAPRVFTVFAPPRERIVIIRRTKIVNRTVIVDRDRDRDRDRDPRRDRDRDRNDDQRRHRVAVNAGIDPGIIAKASGKPIRAAKVEPAVLRGTKVEGAREVDASEGKRARALVHRTNTVIKPGDKVDPPKELANEKGRVGERLSKEAEKKVEGRGNDNRAANNRNNDQGHTSPRVNVIRGGSNEAGRHVSRPPEVARERSGQNGAETKPLPQAARERSRQQDNVRVQSPPPPPEVRRPPPPQAVRAPSPPPAAMRTSAPPPAAMRASAPPSRDFNQSRSQPRDGGGNRQSNRQQDQRSR
jgi:hypothetical protein